MKLLNGKIEEAILTSLLQKKNVSTTDLVESMKTGKTKATKQGIYRVLRKLKNEEMIIIYKSIVSINDLWLFKLRALVEDKGGPSSLIGNLEDLKEKEKISLKIKSLTHLDQIWSNIFLSIESKIPSDVALFLYNPHNWFILFREETDKIHIKRLAKKQRQTFLVIGGTTDADREITKSVRTRDLHSSVNAKIKSKEYLAILGDYIIKVKLSDQENRLIDSVFTNLKNLEDIKTTLYELDMKATSTITVEKNKIKAKEWQKRLSRDFF